MDPDGVIEVRRPQWGHREGTERTGSTGRDAGRLRGALPGALGGNGAFVGPY